MINADAVAFALRAKTHNPRANHVLLLLAFEADARAMVEVSYGWLADRMEVSLSTVSLALGHLLRHGYITVVGKGNRWGATLYQLKLDVDSSYIPLDLSGVDMRDWREKRDRRERVAESEDMGPNYRDLEW